MAIYGCTVEIVGTDCVMNGLRGLSSATRLLAGAYRVNIDPAISLAANEFAVSCTLRNLSVPANSVANALVYKQDANQHELFVLVTLDSTLVDSNFDLVLETYRS